ncbi:hypothetical protein JX265_006242 [Neoarthrinium moseri]|uniref:Rhodopsin domain-containing protein n=1 Tax=Neoarthrinium moseri TaxID=1658444 RepID=A0A9P9WLQ3_9PEZI|nr:hypothetical protein JX266_012061 [Neoarthrinium moseri]KAI1870072.1 hypothetical protein JX265_006242 [Neoarthrinium moseri]
MSNRNLGFDVNPGGTRLVIGQLVFLFFAWIVCSMRAYVKLLMTRNVLIDDWLMLVGLLVYTAYAIIAVCGVAMGGTGKHTSELTLDGVAIALRGWYLCEVLYAPLSGIIRTSIAIFLLRLVVKPWQIWVIRVNLGIIWVTSLVYFFLMTFQCVPPSYFWEGPSRQAGSAGTCMDNNVVPIATIVHSAVSAVSDWMLGLLPIAMLWNVSINRRTKVSIAILLSMGLVAGLALMVRIVYVKKIVISADFLYATIDLAVWSVIEPSLGIMAGCIATIRPLFKRAGFGSTGSRRYGSVGQSSRLKRWYITRHVRKSEAHPNQVLPRSADSDVELQPNRASVEYGAAHLQGLSWDVEGGGHEAAEVADGVNVRTTIEVASSTRSREGPLASEG